MVHLYGFLSSNLHKIIDKSQSYGDTEIVISERSEIPYTYQAGLRKKLA
jgi:hypothetical protein